MVGHQTCYHKRYVKVVSGNTCHKIILQSLQSDLELDIVNLLSLFKLNDKFIKSTMKYIPLYLPC